jgi:hypothetical protein
MMPFLKKDKDSSVSAPVDSLERRPDDDYYESMRACFQDLRNALHQNNEEDGIEALIAAFELCMGEHNG